MTIHWHAFAYTGPTVPPDSEANNPQAPVMPRTLNDWFRKPAQLRKGVFVAPDEAYGWLASELKKNPPGEGYHDPLPHAREHLTLWQDAYVGYYTPGGVTIRALLTCPRTGASLPIPQCPQPPK